MRRRYFATFNLGNRDNSAPSISDIFSECDKWLFSSGHELERPDEFSYKEGENKNFRINGNQVIRYRSYNEEGGGHRALGISYEHPGRSDEGLRWRTDICTLDNEGDGVRTAVILYAGHSSRRLSPGELPISRPRIVGNLVQKFGAHAYRDISREPFVLRQNNIDDFIEFLLSDERELPVVLCSAANSTDKPLIDSRRVADRLVGLAHVYASTNQLNSYEVNDALGRPLGCYNGAVRIYWPGLSKSSNPYDHKLWLARDLVQMKAAFADQILSRIARVSLNRAVPPLLSWEEFERHRVERRWNEAKEEGDEEEVREAFDEVLDLYKSEVDNLEERLEEVESEREQWQNRAEQWRLAYQEAAKSGGTTSEEVVEQTPPQDVEEVLDRISDEFPSRMIIQLNNRSQVKDSPFEKIEALHSALRFLGTTYYEAKTGKRQVPDLSRRCKEQSGFELRTGQSEVTMGQYSDWYETLWNGRRVQLKKHLAFGTSKEPRHTIRVAFMWDDEENVVVVGYVGQHQRTTAT